LNSYIYKLYNPHFDLNPEQLHSITKMSNQLIVFNSTHFNAVQNNLDTVLTIEKKPVNKNSKTYQVEYLNTRWNFDGTKRDGWFKITDAVISKGARNPEDKMDQRNNWGVVPKYNIDIRKSKCGAFGEFLTNLNPVWINTVQGMVDKGEIKLGRRYIADLLQLKVSEKSQENPGADLEDPIIRLRIDLSKYPAKMPQPYQNFANTPKTAILDGDKIITDPNGKKSYAPVMVVNENGVEELVTEQTLYKVLTYGTKIVEARVDIRSAIISQYCISMPLLASKLIIKQTPTATFDDDEVMEGDAFDTFESTTNTPADNNTNNTTIPDDNVDIDNLLKSL